MRLLNTSTLAVEEFHGSDIPEYAILSHTWEHEEVTLQDLRSGKATSMHGYAKLTKCCEQAARDGYTYCWIDTCCIDKTSSAELSEAINSMYAWYRNSHICYAYLTDCEGETAAFVEGYRGFLESRWWTRGWTLQELIAPKSVEFYDADWTLVGTKVSLQEDITALTGIDEDVLRHADPLSHNVAVRMSWAASRQTTRIEDRAYCLMGLFGVNMPLLYGEGNRAFIRLQEEIMRVTEDYTLFIWFRGNSSIPDSTSRYGLLADSPSDFLDKNINWPKTYCNPQKGEKRPRLSIQDLHESLSDEQRLTLSFTRLSKDCSSLGKIPHFGGYDPPTLTSRGLRITLPLWYNSWDETYIACLSILDLSLGCNAYVCITLHDESSGGSRQQYRCDSAGFFLISEEAMSVTDFSYQSVYVQQASLRQVTASQPAPGLSSDKAPYLVLVKPNLSSNARLECLFTSWVNVGHVTTTLSKRKHSDTVPEPGAANPWDVSRARYHFRVHHVASTFTDYHDEEIPSLALKYPLEWCWFSRTDTSSIGSESITGTLAFTHEHYPNSAFVVYICVSETQSLCDVVLTSPRDLEGWKREQYLRQARNVQYQRDRIAIRLNEKSKESHLAHLQAEFTFSIRRIASAKLNCRRYKDPPMRIQRFVLSLTERYMTETGRPFENEKMDVPVFTLTAPD